MSALVMDTCGQRKDELQVEFFEDGGRQTDV